MASRKRTRRLCDAPGNTISSRFLQGRHCECRWDHNYASTTRWPIGGQSFRALVLPTSWATPRKSQSAKSQEEVANRVLDRPTQSPQPVDDLGIVSSLLDDFVEQTPQFARQLLRLFHCWVQLRTSPEFVTPLRELSS